MKTAHISDDRLVELYFTETPSAREQQHLGQCHDCDIRRMDVARLLDETAQAATEEVEAAFPADRLARQQLQIMARAEAAAGPSRVIAFPAAQSTDLSVLSRARSTTRWIAAAAVAGLVVGLVAGRAGREVRPVQFGPASAPISPIAQGPSENTSGIRPVAATLSDDEFLVELESAIESRSAGALRALDELTPRAWDR